MIPGVAVFHPRTEWEQVGFRMAVDFTRLPTAIILGNVDTMVAHYTGAGNVPDGDPGEDLTTMRDYLRAIERDYLANRTGGGYVRKSDGVYFPGYHTGYSFGVDWQGGAWEIRGFDFLPAATNQHNDHTVAVLFFVDGADKANPAMWATARAIGRETRRRAGRAGFKNTFTDHGTLTTTSGTGTATACAGPGIRSQLMTEGFLDMAPTPPPVPPEEPMRVFMVQATPMPSPAPLFASADGLTAVWLSAEQHKALGSPSWEGMPIPRSEARRYTLIGDCPSGYRGIWGQDTLI
jgi:hypothetical protein